MSTSCLLSFPSLCLHGENGVLFSRFWACDTCGSILVNTPIRRVWNHPSLGVRFIYILRHTGHKKHPPVSPFSQSQFVFNGWLCTPHSRWILVHVETGFFFVRLQPNSNPNFGPTCPPNLKDFTLTLVRFCPDSNFCNKNGWNMELTWLKNCLIVRGFFYPTVSKEFFYSKSGPNHCLRYRENSLKNPWLRNGERNKSLY